MSPTEISPGRNTQGSIQKTSRDELNQKEGEHTRCTENRMCRGPKVGENIVTLGGTRRKTVWWEAKERGVWGEAEGVVGAKMGSCWACTLWERKNVPS